MDEDSESQVDRPVVILTDELIAKRIEEENQNRVADSNTIISPWGDESVQGYASDKEPPHRGLREIGAAIRILEEVKIPCCMVAEPALLYYGTTRVMVVGVPLIDDAVSR